MKVHRKLQKKNSDLPDKTMWLKIFPWQRKNEFFTTEEKQLIVEAVRNAERRTSGEVRVFIESRCPYMDAIDRAEQIFLKLQMQKNS